MIALAIIPQPGSNYVSISNEFYKRYEQIKKEMPADITLNIALDQTKFHQAFYFRSGRNINDFSCTGDLNYIPYFSGTGLLQFVR